MTVTDILEIIKALVEERYKVWQHFKNTLGENDRLTQITKHNYFVVNTLFTELNELIRKREEIEK